MRPWRGPEVVTSRVHWLECLGDAQGKLRSVFGTKCRWPVACRLLNLQYWILDIEY